MSDQSTAAAEPFEVRARKSARRQDGGGRIDLMAHARGWVMVRRPGCVPFCMKATEWLALPPWEKPHAD